MPVFVYQCRSCGLRFEKLLLPGRGQDVSCPDCDSWDVEKKIAPVAFVSGRCSAGKPASSSCATCTASSCASCSK